MSYDIGKWIGYVLLAYILIHWLLITIIVAYQYMSSFVSQYHRKTKSSIVVAIDFTILTIVAVSIGFFGNYLVYMKIKDNGYVSLDINPFVFGSY